MPHIIEGEGASTVRERTERALETIDRLDPLLRAMITVTADDARAVADGIDAGIAGARWPGLLAGMTVVLKDNLDTAGIRTTYGSRFFADHVPDADAPVVARLREAGAVILGKANLQELAFGIRSVNPLAGQVANPWDRTRIPGGSSGGSAAAVCAGMADGALGTDTGGSVRIPAAMCGISGLRPTAGRVSNRGSMPVSESLDTVGPMARSVADVARLFAVIAGHDRDDPRSRRRVLENFLPRLGDGVDGLRIGIPRGHYLDGAPDEVVAAVMEAVRVLERAGARLVDVELAGADEACDACSTIILADACAVHAERLDAHPEWFDAQVIERMLRGRALDAVDYARAVHVRPRWQRTLARAFEQIDVIAAPTVAGGVPAIDDERSLVEATAAGTRNTFPGALAEVPALSVPCGFDTDAMPVGLQLIGRWWSEGMLLRVGHAFQAHTAWHLEVPAAAG